MTHPQLSSLAITKPKSPPNKQNSLNIPYPLTQQNNGRQSIEKGTEKTEDHDYPTTKKTDYWLGEAVPTSNRFSTLEEEIPTDDHIHSSDPKLPPIFISGVTNIKPLIELLNALGPNKYLVKTLPHDQVKVQPTESPVYTAIIEALMDRNTEFHTYKPKQDRSFRVVLKNLHPSTDVNDIKQALKEEGHEATNIWNVKQHNTNKPLPIHFVDIKPHHKQGYLQNHYPPQHSCESRDATHQTQYPTMSTVPKVRAHEKLLS
jgi:hypothetical protein